MTDMERLYYLSNWLYRHHVPLLPRLCMLLIRAMYGSFVPYQASIGPGVSFGHRFSIVIAAPSVIGANCKIRHQVTLANSGEGAPVLEDDVYVGCGAVIIGNVRIGRGAMIGANAVVLYDVPAGATVAGVPANVKRMSDGFHQLTPGLSPMRAIQELHRLEVESNAMEKRWLRTDRDVAEAEAAALLAKKWYEF